MEYKEIGATSAQLNRENRYEINFDVSQRRALAANINVGYGFITSNNVRLELGAGYNTNSKVFGLQLGFSKFFKRNEK
jgi:hypothetical protein